MPNVTKAVLNQIKENMDMIIAIVKSGELYEPLPYDPRITKRDAVLNIANATKSMVKRYLSK